MSNKSLAKFKDFWRDVPSVFNDDWFKISYPSEMKKILNGKCDFEELEDRYELELEVPGIKKDEIKVSLKNDYLTIGWNRVKEHKNEKARNASYERSEGSFTRSFYVEGADPGKINAELKNGILKLVLHKKENSKAKQITIK